MLVYMLFISVSAALPGNCSEATNKKMSGIPAVALLALILIFCV